MVQRLRLNLVIVMDQSLSLINSDCDLHQRQPKDEALDAA